MDPASTVTGIAWEVYGPLGGMVMVLLATVRHLYTAHKAELETLRRDHKAELDAYQERERGKAETWIERTIEINSKLTLVLESIERKLKAGR